MNRAAKCGEHLGSPNHDTLITGGKDITAGNTIAKYIESEKVNMTVYDVFQTVPQAATNMRQSAVKGLYTSVQATFLLSQGREKAG